MNQFKENVIKFVKKDTVLCVSFVLAVISVIMVPVDRQYIEYIDYRTLGL